MTIVMAPSQWWYHRYVDKRSLLTITIIHPRVLVMVYAFMMLGITPSRNSLDSSRNIQISCNRITNDSHPSGVDSSQSSRGISRRVQKLEISSIFVVECSLSPPCVHIKWHLPDTKMSGGTARSALYANSTLFLDVKLHMMHNAMMPSFAHDTESSDIRDGDGNASMIALRWIQYTYNTYISFKVSGKQPCNSDATVRFPDPTSPNRAMRMLSNAIRWWNDKICIIHVN